MKQTHVFPQGDSRQHLVDFKQVCWCTPQIVTEVSGDTNVLHRPLKPVVEGHELNIAKAFLTNG